MASSAPLSYSAVRTYLDCPLRYRFLYIDHLTEAPRPYFTFGRTIHSVLEELVRPLVVPSERKTSEGRSQRTLDDWPTPGAERPRTPGVMPLEELDRTYSRLWTSEGYETPQEESRYRSLGTDILHRFYAELTRSPPAPVAVEQHLEATWEGIPVHGYIDRLDRTPEGGLEIVDYKTSREVTGEEARTSDQLSLYQVLVEQNYARPVERLTLYHLRSLTPVAAPRRDAVALEGLLGRVAGVRDGIRTENFEPTPGRVCQRCEFKSLCPEFRNVPEADRERLAGLVDRFLALREQELRTESEVSEAAEALHREAERLGVHRLPGSRNVLVRHREESWHFPPELVRPILETEGVSGQVDSRDPEAFKRWLKDPRTDPGTRRRIEEKGHRQVRWFWSSDDNA